MDESMKAPEKIYLYPSDLAGIDYEAEWGDKPWGEDCVEYTRTDAFIDKACLYLFENYHGEKLSLRMIENFKKYLKGE